jgi:glyoxylase-like metal-dependent hydrolase (beta-lactamase superfamily II)
VSDHDLSRRVFLGLAGATAASAAAGWAEAVPAEESLPSREDSKKAPRTLRRLSEHLFVYEGPIHVGVVRDGARALLIDCGDASVLAALEQAGVTAVERVLFTHHHRDQACGAHRLVERGAKLSVPKEERDYFASVKTYWEDPKNRWHIYNQHPHHLMLAEPVPVDETLAAEQTFRWGPAAIRVLSTPGHTDGSISFAIEVDGKRVVFCGDVLYDEGRIWDLHSLQKGTVTSDYHGFLGARPKLVEGLRRIESAKPDLLVPSHGRVVERPVAAIEAVVQRLEEVYDKYVAISALRHYFPKMFEAYAGRKGHMPIRPGKAVPDCLRHFGTTWVLVSRDKAALVMDCGGEDVVKRLREMQAKGEIRGVEGLWVTHYHDDHVDAIPAFQKAFDCPCITDRAVAEVITDPTAWRLPCISPSKARVDRATKDGESWQWHEFRLTAYHFPGQTLYHSGLLVETGDLKMFFTGDSFTGAGIDDYCVHNRDWVGRGVGFDRCIALLDRLRPTHLFNCHVDLAFEFTPEECAFMRANLAEREKLYAALFPWENPNFAIDEPWARCWPYEQRVRPGEKASLRVVVTNHADAPRQALCRAVLPRAWGGPTTTAWQQAECAAKQDSQVPLAIDVPATARPGRYVIPIDLHFGDWVLPQFTEAIVVV